MNTGVVTQRKISTLLALLLIGSYLIGCEKTTASAFDDIDAIVANPKVWEGKSVRVRGKVCGQYSLIGVSASGYDLCSQTSAVSIFVTSSSKAPPSDAVLIVIGEARNVIVVGDVAAGLHLKERTRVSIPRLGKS